MGNTFAFCNNEETEIDKTLASGKSFRRNLIRSKKNTNVFQEYEPIKVIGTGSISTITSIRKRNSDSDLCSAPPFNIFRTMRKEKAFVDVGAVHKHSKTGRDQYFALKTINLLNLREEYHDELRNEIDILKRMDHPNIVKAYETYEHRGKLSLVMELCTGGDLSSRHPYTEKEACHIVHRILSAVAYMHLNNIVHRDLKFENIMFESKNSDAEVKVIDFGLSKKYLGQNEVMHETVGTLYTMAPEVIQESYTTKADMWSIGVIAYMLLSGKKPFWGRDSQTIISKVMRGHYTFKGPHWQNISNEAKEFVRSLLKLNPRWRLSAEEALHSPWFKKSDFSHATLRKSVDADIYSSLLKFTGSSEFKKRVHMIIAFMSNSEEICKLRQAFEAFDTSDNGYITYDEFQLAFIDCCPVTEDLHTIFNSADINHDGRIGYTEFLAATLENKVMIEEDRLAEAFDLLDVDHSGFISKKDLREVLGKECTEELVKRLIDEVDIDHDGQISFDDFLVALQGVASERSNKFSADANVDTPRSSSFHNLSFLVFEKVFERYRHSIQQV